MQFLNEEKRAFYDITEEDKGLLLLAFHCGKTIEAWDGETWRPTRKKGEWVSPFEESRYIFRIKPEPVKQVHWCNDYGDETSNWWWSSRAMADDGAGENRIGVIRREIVDGVVSYFKENV